MGSYSIQITPFTAATTPPQNKAKPKHKNTTTIPGPVGTTATASDEKEQNKKKITDKSFSNNKTTKATTK